MREPLVLFEWAVSSFFGWGIYGLNLLLAWSGRTDLMPATMLPVDEAAIEIDPLEHRAIAPALRLSEELQAEMRRAAGRTATTSRLVLKIVENGFAPFRVAHDVVLRGTPSVGMAFLEQAVMTRDALERLKTYPLIVAGSSWTRDIVRQAGAGEVAVVLQGVDTSHFHPAPRRGAFPGRFVVFSGGKTEYRKGQDLVLRGFRRFAARHPEALLLTAWGSPWPSFASSIPPSADLAAPPRDRNGQVDLAGWTRLAGIADSQVIHCGAVANRAMPRILREADVALFPNRGEGGTNLVAMECLACGVPTILSANTGHLDLLRMGVGVPLQRQGRIEGAAYTGWGASDPDEIVEALEAVYQRPEESRARAAADAAVMARLTWAAQMATLADLLLPLMPP